MRASPLLLVPLLPLLSACGKDSVEPDCDVVISEHMATLPVLTVALDEPADVEVSWTIGGETFTQSAEATSEHRLALGGATGDTEVQWSVSVDGGAASCEGSVTTEPLPDNLPQLDLTVAADGELAGPRFLMGSVFAINGQHNLILVFDRQGRVVWYHEVDDGDFVVDTQLARDGGGLLHNVFDAFFREDIAVMRRLDIEGQLVEELRTELGHHMFAQLPDGVLTYQSLAFEDWTDPESKETETVVGDLLVERSADGSEAVVFNLFDWLEVERNFFFDFPSLYPQGIDWSHGNAIKYDEARDSYLFSTGNTGILMDIDRATGAPTQLYGNVSPDEGVPLAEGVPPFEHPHDPSWLDNGNLLIFTSDFAAAASGAVEYAVEDGELVEVWRHGLDGEIFSALLGQAVRYENGDTLVNFGGTPVLRQVSAEGEVIWEIRGVLGYGFAQFVGLDSFAEIAPVP